MKRRDYNAMGCVRLASCAADMVSMFVAGSEAEIRETMTNMYEVARVEFPNGPLTVRDALNAMSSELDLPLVIDAKEKDTGKIR